MKFLGMGLISAGAFTERDLRNVWIFHVWTIGSVFAFVGAGLLLGMPVVTSRVIAWLLIGLNLVILAGAVRAYMSFIRQADELVRKIQLEGLAFAVAAGAVFTVVYRLCELVGAPRLTLEVPLLMMMCFWLLGQRLGVRRYFGGAEDQ